MNTLMEKHGVLIFLKVEFGNKLLTIIILENNMQESDMIYDPVKDKFLIQQPYASWSLDSNDDWQAPITYPTVTDDGADPVVWRYIISWNDTKYNADNTPGWEAIKSNDTSETPTKYNWDASALAWVSE